VANVAETGRSLIAGDTRSFAEFPASQGAAHKESAPLRARSRPSVLGVDSLVPKVARTTFGLASVCARQTMADTAVLP